MNAPSSKDTKPHRRATHNDAITIPWKVGKIMLGCATPEAHKIVSVATNNAETARCYNTG
jgi:hypothetical protein